MSDIVERFARIAVDQPDRPVIHASASNEVLSAAQVWRSHLHLRQQLSTLGVQPGQLVVSAAGNRPVAIPLMLACLSLRAPLMPVDAGATAANVAESAARFGAFAIMLPEGTVTRQPGDPRTYPNAALLKVTSGTTGLPKAIVTTEPQMIADGERIIGTMGIRPGDRQLAVIPLSHAYGFGNLLMPVLLQGTAIVLRDSFVPSQLLLDAGRFRTRVFAGVPYMFNYLNANQRRGEWPSCLQLLISAGARLDAELAQAFRDRFGIKIHSFYGTSETGGIAYDGSEGVMPDGYVGMPMPGVTILSRPDEEAPDGSGRLFVRSDGVASGYVGDTEDPAFIDDGFLTGDFGFVDNEGRLMLTGRASPAVNVAGRKVHPAEVERVLRTMDGVDDVCVIAAPDALRGQQILACIVSRQVSSALAVRRFCSARLAPHKVPRAIIFLPSLPLTPRGKIDREQLLQLALDDVDDERS